MRRWCKAWGSQEAANGKGPALSVAVLLLVSCTVLGGCALFPSRPAVPLKQATAAELTALLREREAAIQTMKGLFRVSIKGEGIPIAQRIEGAMYYRRPDAMRLQGFTALGGELFEFVLSDDLYKLRLPTMSRVLTGRSSEIGKMGKLARPFQLSVWAMSGAVGIASVARHERVALKEDGDRYRLDVFASGEDNSRSGTVVRRLWFERRSLQVVQEERLSPTGELEAVMYFDDFRPVGESEAGVQAEDAANGFRTRLMRPFKITMEDGHGQGRLQVTFHEIVPNVPLRPADLGTV
jgi:hypothetical protein